MTGNDHHKPSVLETVDDLVATVPWDEARYVRVIRRQHGGRTYIRLHRWNRPSDEYGWYPNNRVFVIPIGRADALAGALEAAARSEVGEKPNWLAAREQEEATAEGETAMVERLRNTLTV